MKNIINLENKKIIVTGASSGIGREISKEISEVGGNVMLIGRNEQELQNTKSIMERPENHGCFRYDLTDIYNIKPLIEKIVNFDGARIDGFVHAAGIEVTLPIKLVSYKKFDEAMRLHLYSFIEIIKILSNKQYNNNGLNIIALSSIAAVSGGQCQTIYSASKGAIDAAIIPLSKELAAKNIRINSIRPSIIKTPMTEKWAAKKGIEDLNELDKTQLLGLGEPQDVANMVLFLLSSASRFITGKSFSVDGGGPRGVIF